MRAGGILFSAIATVAELHRARTLARAARTGAGRLRPGDRLGAARCGRGTGMALPGRGDRDASSAAPKASRSRVSGCSKPARSRPTRTIPAGRRRPARGLHPRRPRRRLPGERDQSARRPRRPCRAHRPARRDRRGQPAVFGRNHRAPAGCSITWRRRRQANPGAAHPRGAARSSRSDLAGPDYARRHGPGRYLAPPALVREDAPMASSRSTSCRNGSPIR